MATHAKPMLSNETDPWNRKNVSVHLSFQNIISFAPELCADELCEIYSIIINFSGFGMYASRKDTDTRS